MAEDSTAQSDPERNEPRRASEGGETAAPATGASPPKDGNPPDEGEQAGKRGQDDKKDDGDEKGGEDEKHGKDDGKSEEKKPTPKWPFVVGGIVVLGFIGIVLWIIFRPRPDVWTDDAYVMAHYASIAPRVSGQVESVPVDDNQPVKVGQVLTTLDPRDYQAAVEAAEAAVARDTAQVEDVSANIGRQPPLIDEQDANVRSADARLAFAEADARRFRNLAPSGAATMQQYQQAYTTLQQSRAQLDSARAAAQAARRQLDVLRAQKKVSEATLQADQAQLERAKLNLSYTRITAPLDGLVAQRSVQVGNTVAPGATLMGLVPLDEVYVIANYREVDLVHVRNGQTVTIHVDAYDIDLDGTVHSIAPASGASFAPIQPNNATGNFTKIVQRLPVKIVVRPDQPVAKLLRVGFSVETTIHTGLEDVVDEQRRTQDRVTERR